MEKMKHAGNQWKLHQYNQFCELISKIILVHCKAPSFYSTKLGQVSFHIENKDRFCYKSANPWRIILTSELDRDIHETNLCAKFQLNLISFFKSYRVNGWTDILTDFRVYSIFEYTKRKLSKVVMVETDSVSLSISSVFEKKSGNEMKS